MRIDTAPKALRPPAGALRKCGASWDGERRTGGGSKKSGDHSHRLLFPAQGGLWGVARNRCGTGLALKQAWQVHGRLTDLWAGIWQKVGPRDDIEQSLLKMGKPSSGQLLEPNSTTTSTPEEGAKQLERCSVHTS